MKRNYGFVNRLARTFGIHEEACPFCRERGCMLTHIHNVEGNYGGRQSWFEERMNDHYGAMRGCGMVAIINQLAALASYDPRAKALLPESGLPSTIDDYVKWVYEMKPYLWPTLIGIPFGFILRRGANRYAKSKGIRLKWSCLRGVKSKDKELAFIHRALANGVPVAEVLWWSPLPELRWHWISITGIQMRADDDVELICANHGRQRVYSWDLLRRPWSVYRMLQFPVIESNDDFIE